jgi:hypothetical protein
MGRLSKDAKTSKYFGVYKLTKDFSTQSDNDKYMSIHKNRPWIASLVINKRTYRKYFTDEIQAAKWVDMRLIENNLPPKNFFKKKES